MKKTFKENMNQRIISFIEKGTTPNNQLEFMKKQIFEHYNPILCKQIAKMGDQLQQIESIRSKIKSQYQDMEHLLSLLGSDDMDETVQQQFEQLQNANNILNSIFKNWDGGASD